MSRKVELLVKVNRKTPAPALQPFTDYFEGFEKVDAVRKVFGDETEAVLARLKIGFVSNRRMYMGIRDDDGNVAVGTYHLRHSPRHVLYLDVVHELFHIKQWMEDKEWFTKEHQKFMGDFSLYYASPIEVPAYKHAVREAERLGMSSEEITEYLKMMPVPPKVWNRFLKEMGIKKARATASGKSRARGGLIAFTKTVAREVARHHINVNCVCPGPSDTPLFQKEFAEKSPKLAESLKRVIPWGRLGMPDDVAPAVVFLASDDASFITGQTLSVSGGLTMV